MNDIPVSKPILEDIPYSVEPTKRTENPTDAIRRKAQTSILLGDAEGTPAFTNWQSLQKSDIDTQVQFEIAADNANKRKEAEFNNQATTVLSAIADPALAEAYVVQHNANSLARMAENSQIGAAEKTYVDTSHIPFPMSFTPEQAQDYAARLTVANKIATLSESITGWEIAGEIGVELVLSPKYLIDSIQASGEVLPSNAKEMIVGLIADFQALSPADKVLQYPIIEEHLLEAMPRPRAVQVLSALIDPSQLDEVEWSFGGEGYIQGAAIALGVIGTVSKLRKLFSITNQLRSMGRSKEAADLNIVAAGDKTGQIEAEFGVSQTTATNSLVPFKGVDTQAVPDISAAAQQQLIEFEINANRIESSIATGDSHIPEGLLNPAEQAARSAVFETDFTAQLKYMKDQAKINGVEFNIKDLEKTESASGIKYTFKYTDPEGNVQLGVFEKHFRLDEVGHWIGDDGRLSIPNFSSARGWLNSPRRLSIGTLAEEDVKAALRVDLTSAALKQRFRKLFLQTVSGLKKDKFKSKKTKVLEVDSVLSLGDEAEHVYTTAELRAGVNGYRFGDDQIAAYFKARSMFDSLGRIRNIVARNDFIDRGVKTIFRGKKAIGFGEVRETIDEAEAAIRQNHNVASILNLTDGGAPITRLWLMEGKNLAQAYADGYRLVKLEEDLLLPRVGRFEWALVRQDNLRGLPETVLELKKGYVTRINPKANWFVKTVHQSNLNGLRAERVKTVRTFDNESDALTYADQLRNDLAVGKTIGVETEGKFTGVQVGRDSETATLRNDGSVHGLIYSPRAKERIPHNFEDSPTPPREGAFEALKLYMENTNSFVTRNQWRMGMRKRWENTAQKLLGKEARVNFDEPGTNLPAEMLSWRDQIITWSGWTDKTEDHFDRAVLDMYDWAMAPGGKRLPFIGINVNTRDSVIPQVLHTLRHRDPIASVRSATFHTLLGMYNPIQLFVQAQGAAVAASANLMHPILLTRLIGRGAALRAVMHLDADSKAFATMAKSFGQDVKELAAYKQLWDKTGLYDSILSNADVEAAARGYPVTRTAFTKFLNSGLAFYREGELFNRGLAFMTAVEEMGGVKKILGNHALEAQMLSRISDFTLNLQKANKAAWQNGPLSLTTQFLQIVAKTGESLFGANAIFDKAQRTRMIIAQLALYGSAGIPLGHLATNWILSQAGVNRLDINEEKYNFLVTWLNGGLLDTSLQGMGIDVTFGERASLAQGFDQTLISLFTDDRAPAWEALAGPSSTIPQRLYDTFSNAKLFFYPHMPPNAFRDSPNWTPQNFLDTANYLKDIATGPLSAMIGITSTTRQLYSGWVMHRYNQILSQRGAVIDQRDYDIMTELAVAVGFNSLEKRDAISLRAINQGQDQFISDESDDVITLYIGFMNEVESAANEGRQITPERYSWLEARKDNVINSILDPIEKERVMQQVLERMQNPVSQLDKELARYLKSGNLDFFSQLDARANQRVIQTERK